MTRARSRVLALGALVAIVTLGMFPITAGTARAADPTAEFDWAMPPRTGLDANDDGVLDTRLTRFRVDPPSWRVDFDACDSIASDGASIVRYTWLIDGQPVGDGAGVTSCDAFSYHFPEEGVYRGYARDPGQRRGRGPGDQGRAGPGLARDRARRLVRLRPGQPRYPHPRRPVRQCVRARATLTDRLRELGDLEDAYERTERKVGVARQRYHELLNALDYQADVCNALTPPSTPTCACRRRRRARSPTRPSRSRRPSTISAASP